MSEDEQTPPATPESEDGGRSPEPDWKTEARKHEKRARDSFRELEKLRRELEEHRQAGQSEHEKALAQAREEARREALEETAKERRAERLEYAIRDAAHMSGFRDPKDALKLIDGEELFDENGKIDTDALNSAIAELLQSKPYLASNGKPKVEGSADGGKGAPAPDPRQSMTVEDAFKWREKHRSLR